jgi:hypothetical protein
MRHPPRYTRLLACFLLLFVAPACRAQTVTVRLINSADGHPLPKQTVMLSLFYDKGEKPAANFTRGLTLETDTNGRAQFTLPDPPPAHLAASVKIDWARWHCACTLLAATEDVTRKGIVVSAAVHGDSTAAKAAPGEVLFLARPLTFFERILYQLMKE